MILLVSIAALVATPVISVLTLCAVAVRTMRAPVRVTVGPPPMGIGAGIVAVVSGTGDTLAGWFVPGMPGRGAVLLVHGIRSDRRILAGRMSFLARAGVAVLAIDLRAHGESLGSSITFGRLEALDIAGAVAWLREAAPGERLAALGISLGGAAVALATPSVPIDALVLESVFPDIASAISNRMRLVAGPVHRWLTPVFMAVGTVLTGLRPRDLRPIDALAAYGGPVLILSGSEDRLTTASETRALYTAASDPKELWLVRGAGHVDLASAAGADYETRILAFIHRHLVRVSACA